MPKLNQIIAIEKGKKERIYGAVTQLDRRLHNEDLLKGISRTYAPKDEDGDRLPPESQRVQLSTRDVLGEVCGLYEDLWDVIATKEWANTEARSDLVLADGTVLLREVPATYFLFLEKQLTDVRTLIGRAPILDPGENWTWDANSNAYRSDLHQTVKTQKVPHVLIKYEATPEHPAQTDVYHVDEPIGTWSTHRFSGAMPAEERSRVLARVEEILLAVKQAREAANNTDVTSQTVAAPVLDYIFEPLSTNGNGT